jgi:AcrR family transcriptional regulator
MPRALGQIDQRKSEAILDAASEVLSERGLGASVEEIARRAEVSKQTVYNHFGGCRRSSRALAGRRSNVVTASLAEPGAAEDPETALYGYARSLLEAVASERHAQVMRLTILSAGEHPDLAEALLRRRRPRLPRASRRFLAEEDRAGRLHVEDPALAAEFFSGMILSSVQIQGLLNLGFPDADEIERRARAAAAAFMRAYAPRTRPRPTADDDPDRDPPVPPRGRLRLPRPPPRSAGAPPRSLRLRLRGRAPARRRLLRRRASPAAARRHLSAPSRASGWSAWPASTPTRG